jgi:hypothetical protein
MNLFESSRKNSNFSSLCIGIILMAVAASVSADSHKTPSDSRNEVHALASRRGMSHKRAVQWVVLGRPGKDSVRIGNNFAWCPDAGSAAAPRITGVQQTDRRYRVTLTVYLVSGDPSHCPGVEAAVERVVHIRGGLRGRALYDGSQQTPVRRWPRRGAG